jgi:aquaporin Z
MMNKYFTELIGTFFLVFTVACTVIAGGTGVIPPLAIGAALMVMVYAGGHISGGHYNPAVSLGVWIRGGMDVRDLVSYWVFQIAGASLAALAAHYIKGGATVTPIVLDVYPALLAEFLFTFALVWVVLNVATVKANSGNSFFGLAIGMTVMTGAFAVGNISGGAFNPAVAFGISLLGLAPWPHHWIYPVAEFAAGAAAALAFKALNRADR